MKGLNWKSIATGFIFYLTAFEGTRWLMFHDPTFGLAQMASSQFASHFLTCLLLASSAYLAAGAKADSAIKNSGVCGALIILSVILSAAIASWKYQHGIQVSQWILNSLPFFGEVFLFTIVGGYLRSRRNLKTNRVLDSTQPPIPLP